MAQDPLHTALELLGKQLKECNIRLRKQDEELAARDKKIEELTKRINELLSNIEWLKRKIFGKMSEKQAPINPAQLTIPFENEELESLSAQIDKAREQAEQQIEQQKEERRKAKPRKNRALLENLPVIEEVMEPMGIDLNRYKKIGEEHTRVLEMIPGRIYVRDIIRPKYGLKDNTDTAPGVVIAPMVLMPIYKGMAGPSMCAEVLLKKYQYHMPFYRQAQEYKHLGLPISANTIGSWFSPLCELLKPIYLEIKRRVLASSYIQADETVLPVIDKDQHKAAQRYLWLTRSVNDKLLFFHYDNGARTQKAMLNLFQNYEGYMQTDGYPAYDILENSRKIKLVGCLAHIRRFFERALTNDKARAEYAIKQIQSMYNVEHIIRDQKLEGEAVIRKRQELAKPIADAFEKWMENNYSQVLKTSPIGKAIAYAYSIWPRMQHYLSEPQLIIDNNGAENAIRPITISRKNFLFCGNHEAAEHAAMVITLLGSCREQDINPREYLTDVLAKLPYYLEKGSGLNISDLVPDVWKQMHEAVGTYKEQA